MSGWQYSHPPPRQSDPQEASKQRAIFVGEPWLLLHLLHSTRDELTASEEFLRDQVHTMSCRGSVSFSEVIRVLWIKNLSLHLAAVGGSSFIGCSMTRFNCIRHKQWSKVVVSTSTHLQHQHSLLALFFQNLDGHSTATYMVSSSE